MIRVLFLFIYIQSYITVEGQKPGNTEYFTNPNAKKLNDSAVSVVMHSQNYARAIILLDKALKIDSNYLRALSNKLTFELELKKYDEAIGIFKTLIRIEPGNPEYLVSTGMIYFIINDTLSSQMYFNEAALKIDKILDTISIENKSYDYILMDKALSMIFIGNKQMGNDILKKLYNKAKDTLEKEMYSHYMNKPKEEIINSIFNGNKDSGSSTTFSVEPLELDTVQFSTIKASNNYNFETGLYLLKLQDTKSRGFNLQNTNEYYYIVKNITMSLKNIDSVYKKYDRYDKKFILDFNFNKTGTKQLNDFTMKCTNQKIGLLINNKLVFAGLNFGPIENGEMALSGKFTENDIDNMRLLIENAIKNLKK